METSSIALSDLIGELNEVESLNAPKVVYVKGNTSLLKKTFSISVIGTRRPTPDGIKRTKKLVSEIVKKNGIVVSGLASGIDTEAHLSAINMGGSTVAVIGTPIDQYYPSVNKMLQEQIGKNHLLISQFPSTSGTKPQNFILRNKTMALISNATVIIEANEKSGTIHQAKEAIRLGRPLYLLESLANNQSLSWPKELIDKGARILKKETIDSFFTRITKTVDK